MLNWIVWNWTVYMYKNESGTNNLQWLMYHKPNQTKSNLSLWIDAVDVFWSPSRLGQPMKAVFNQVISSCILNIGGLKYVVKTI